MYDKARRGESIELAPRRISIFKFDIERSLDDRYWFCSYATHLAYKITLDSENSMS